MFSWAGHFCQQAKANGFVTPYKKICMYTEFTGSGCAETALESLINCMDEDHQPEVVFKTMADIKPACRRVCMNTRRVLTYVES